jgi:hypothetical protein
LEREATLVFGNGAKVRKKRPRPLVGCGGDKVGAGPGVPLMREVYLQFKEWLISQIRGGFISAKEVSALILGSV